MIDEFVRSKFENEERADEGADIVDNGLHVSHGSTWSNAVSNDLEDDQLGFMLGGTFFAFGLSRSVSWSM